MMVMGQISGGVWTSFAAVVLLIGGCGQVDSQQRGSGKDTIRAVTTVGMVADIVSNVGASRVETIQLMGAGVDPHLYRAKTHEVRMLQQADVIFYAGLMLEGKMVDRLLQIGRQRPVYAISEGIPQDQLLEPADFAGHYDPHAWMDVSLWSHGVSTVVAGLSELAPQWKDEFIVRGAEYQQRLEQLDRYARTTLGTIPESNRVLITSHDAFNYFGRAYHLEVLGIQGLSTESEAGLQRINDLVSLLVDRQILAVFVESSVSDKNIRALIEGALARGHQVRQGGILYSDAMGPKDTPAGNYIGMIEHNVNTVTAALGGQVPAGGFASFETGDAAESQ